MYEKICVITKTWELKNYMHGFFGSRKKHAVSLKMPTYTFHVNKRITYINNKNMYQNLKKIRKVGMYTGT